MVMMGFPCLERLYHARNAPTPSPAIIREINISQFYAAFDSAPASEHQLVVVLLQLAITIGVARVWAADSVGWQPAVVGEIAAGLVLGPSVLGKIEMWSWDHRLFAAIFDPAVSPIFNILSCGLADSLLFLVGLEFDSFAPEDGSSQGGGDLAQRGDSRCSGWGMRGRH